MKREMSVMTGKPVCRFIEACEVQSSWRNSLPNFWTDKPKQLNLKVSIERHEKPNIAWRISELMPRKTDLEELSRNSEYQIIPTCTDHFELVTFDPQVERILKVMALENGHLLIFIQNLVDPCLHVYSCPRLGSKLDIIKRRFIRGYDLLFVDEATKFVALYDMETSKVAIYKFDENFRNLDWTRVDVDLHKFFGIGVLTWMYLIPEALVSVDGSFLFVFRKSSDNTEVVEASKDMMEVDGKSIDSSIALDIYVLAGHETLEDHSPVQKH